MKWGRLRAETVTFLAAASFDYRWSDGSHYLALHDIRLSDGEIAAATSCRSSIRDLRGTLTYAPAGCEIAGWSSLTDGAHSFTSMSICPELMSQELERHSPSAGDAPKVYFRDGNLRTTLLKMRELLLDRRDPATMHLETLGLLAIFELDRLHRERDPAPPMARGHLGASRAKLVREFMLANLAKDVTLQELADLSGLSRFHFARAFKSTFGDSPYRYLTDVRLQHARELLMATRMTIADIAKGVGFASASRFAAAFKAKFGVSPSALRSSG